MQLVVFRPRVLRPPVVLAADEFDDLERREQAKAAAELAEERRALAEDAARLREEREEREERARQRRDSHSCGGETTYELMKRRARGDFTPVNITRPSSSDYHHERHVEPTVDPAPRHNPRGSFFYTSDRRAQAFPHLGYLPDFQESLQTKKPISVQDLKRLRFGEPRSGPLADFYPGLYVKKPEACVDASPPTPGRVQFKTADPKIVRLQEIFKTGEIPRSPLSGTIGGSKITKGPKHAGESKAGRGPKTTNGSMSANDSETKDVKAAEDILTDTTTAVITDVVSSLATTSGPSPERPLTPVTGALVPSPRHGDEARSPKRQAESGPLADTDDGYPTPKRQSPTPPSSPKVTKKTIHAQQPQLLEPAQSQQLFIYPQPEIVITQPHGAQQPQMLQPVQNQLATLLQPEAFRPPQLQTFDPGHSHVLPQWEQQTYQQPQPAMPQFHPDPQPAIVPPD